MLLPQKRYERSMNHNYLILSTYQFFDHAEEESYMTRMLLANQIQGLLPVVCRHSGGEKQYCYEINSLQSLYSLYEKQEIDYEVLHKLLAGCIRCFERLEEYLLDGSQILLQPEYIYLHMDTKEPFFVCYPDYDTDVRKAFQKLIDYLLTKINHTQEQAVWLAYQVYRYTRNPNYVLSEVKTLLYESQEMIENAEWNHNSELSEMAKLDELTIENNESLHENADEQYYFDKNENRNTTDKAESYRWNKNVLGALLCTLLTLSAIGIIFGARLLKLIPLSQKQEVSLYGAIGMSVVAAGIFFVSILKKWRQEEQIQALSEESEEEIEYCEQDIRQCEKIESHVNNDKSSDIQRNVVKSLAGQQTSELTGATRLLSEELVQERCLKGLVNGVEMRIPLIQFPLTIGKLAQFCDVVIPDNTVSRMHARLEERDGKVYILDLNSTNGTLRNGDLLNMHEEVAMEPGDKIMIGRVCLTYC